ncbi:MAG: bifunctional folylpolyglutamate synthase/dihydrofolate synthase [Elsteraceae bacterium]
MDLTLGRMRRLMAALDHPERRAPPVVHVAGTNGKGSLCAYLQAIAEAAGLKAHRFTSPALVNFNERILLAGQEIPDATLEKLLDECEAANAGQPITLFEITTAVAFKAFADHPADLLILEVGMGGRMDSTNLIDQPLATAITPISMDHMDFLGHTITAIASEKAGIMKRGVPVVIGRQVLEAAETLERIARRVRAPLSRMGREWTAERRGSRLIYESPTLALDLPPPALAGLHQYDNAATAIACVEQMRRRLNIPDQAIADGLARAVWPARLQRLKTGPIVDALPSGVTLWLDGMHNADSGRVIAESLAGWTDRPIGLVWGMMGNKAAEDLFAPLAPHLVAVRTVSIPDTPNARPPADLARIAQSAGVEANEAASVAEGVAALAKAGCRSILIGGSLYLAGTVLKDHS